MAKIWLCIDGLEDGAPAAPLPLLDRACTITGTLRTAPAGEIPDSLRCILRMLGAREQELPHGRAALEALALGLSPRPDELFFRGTLCALDAAGRIQPAPAHSVPPTPDMPADWSFFPLAEYRSLLRISRFAQLPECLHTCAPHQHFGEPVSNLLPQGGDLANRLSAWIRHFMQANPGWVILPWSGATYRPLFRFAERWQQSAVMICHAEIVKGLADALGIARRSAQCTTGDTDTDLVSKLQAVLQEKQQASLVLCHINGCDEAGHRKNRAEKKAFCARIADEFLSPLLKQMDKADELLVCSDHWTVSETGSHAEGLVRFWIMGAKSPGRRAKQWQSVAADMPLRLLLNMEGSY